MSCQDACFIVGFIVRTLVSTRLTVLQPVGQLKMVSGLMKKARGFKWYCEFQFTLSGLEN